MRLVIGLMLAIAAGSVFAAELDRTPIEAATVDGKKVHLFPNGRWAFVDPDEAAAARQRAEQYPENRTRPMDSQGVVLGDFGRVILPGDKDYNRGTLNPKMR